MRTDRFLASSLALAVASAAHSQVHVYVDDDAPNGGNGLSWDSAMNDLQEAIDLAETLGSSRGEVRIAGGVYKPGKDVPFQIPEPIAGQPVYRLLGGHAGLDDLSNPNIRDRELHPTVIDADINGDDAKGGIEDNAINLLVVDGRYASGAPLSAVVLGGLSFRGAVGVAVSIDEAHAAVSDCTFQNNASTALDLYDSAVSINGCEFVGNTASSGAAIFSRYGSLLIAASQFSENESAEEGGAVNIFRSAANVRDSEFINNNAENGGAIHTDGITNNFIDLIFTGNSASNEGGAIRALRDLNLHDSVFTLNHATHGGAVVGEGYFNGCSFVENTAQSDSELRVRGGAVYANGFATIDECEFDGNSAYEGGGVYVWQNYHRITMNDCVLRSNSASAHGGGVYGVRSIYDCVFEGNSTEGSGGGAFGPIDIANCLFVGNTAGYGGGLYDAGTIEACQVAGNHAQYGGGVYVPTSATTVISDSVMYNNTCVSYGSAIYSRGVVDLLRSTISQSDPTVYTTLITLRDGVGWIESSIVWDNRLAGFPAIELFPDTSLAMLFSALRFEPGSLAAHPSANLDQLGVNIEADPMFTDVASGDLALLPGSPCIDAGLLLHVSELPSTDALGDPRHPLDDRGMPNTGFGEADYLDVGALEFQGTSCLADVNGDGDLTPTDFSAWVGAYQRGDAIADQNRDGDLTPTDFSAWVNNYTNGC